LIEVVRYTFAGDSEEPALSNAQVSGFSEEKVLTALATSSSLPTISVEDITELSGVSMVAPVDINRFMVSDSDQLVFVVGDDSSDDANSEVKCEKVDSEQKSDSPKCVSSKRKRRYQEDPSDDPETDKRRKNALTAKQNRDKKNKHIEELETTVDALTSKNKVLSSENIEMKSKVQSLEEQISYLKSVILNQSSLSCC